MESKLWTVILLLAVSRSSFCKILCRNTARCSCYPGEELEFQCPPGDYGDEFMQGAVIHVTEGKSIEMDCHGDMKEFDLRILPNITVGEVEKFQIRFCPTPRNVSAILEWFSLQKVSQLRLNLLNLSNVVLGKDYFDGLDDFEILSLNLDGNDIVYMEDDVFANTLKLINLELQNNKIEELKPDIFKDLKFLKSLDLSGNNLVDLQRSLFQSLNNLTYLHLWNNNITRISSTTFFDVPKLMSLELSGNNLENVSEDAFSNLPKLSTISMSKNKLNQISENLFRNNIRLRKIRLSNNPSLTLPENLFLNLSSLEEVDLSNSNLESIPEDIFVGCGKLSKINLERNKLSVLPPKLFSGLKNLSTLYLSQNRIQNISHLFNGLEKLKELHLQENLISSIDQNSFESLNGLEVLHIEKNQISQIHFQAFYKIRNLEELYLSHNKYVFKDDQSFLEQNVNLQTVDLSHNFIDSVQVINLLNKVKLSTLILSHNNISHISMKHLQTISNDNVDIHLEHNNIVTVDFKDVEALASLQSRDHNDIYSNTHEYNSVIYLANNPIRCNCYNYDLWRYFNDKMDPNVRVMYDVKDDDVMCDASANLHLKDVRPQYFTCGFDEISEDPKNCPDVCTCEYRPYDKSLVATCNNNNLTEIPNIVVSSYMEKIVNQTELHFENNSLANLSPGADLSGYDNITKLFLSNNQISNITKLPSNLQILTLDNNKLKDLKFMVLQQINRTELSHLTLHNNPWRCDCAARNFTEFLRQYPVIKYQDDILCDGTGKELKTLYRIDLCQEWEIIYLVLFLVCFLLVLAVTAAFYYRYQQEVKVWLFAKNLCLWWVTEEELDKDKQYDAFISFSHKDEDFVTQNLLPVLESGPRPYKLCIHFRDWKAGEFIATQIANSVNDSKRTLVVLSPSFLESVWGKMEFRTAHTKAMSEGRARVIVVLYGEIDVDGLDNELKTYLKTNTYVQWGDPYFWNKLRYALPHSHRNITKNNQKHANMMTCIDDKFKLVSVTPTPNPDSTPPVEPALSKHPLNFLPHSESENLQVQSV